MDKEFRRRSKSHLMFFIIFALLVFQSLALANDKAQKINDLVSQYNKNGDFMGSVLVSENGKVIYKKAFGLANIGWETPNTMDTKFRLASMTKQFTSMLVLQMVEKGKMKLDAKITDYIPEYPKPHGDIITIHHLLSHTSGMPHYGGIPGFFPKLSRQPYTSEEYMKLFWDLDLLSETGSQFSYSSFGYYLLGYMLERLTGETYAQLLHDRIFEPLGMNNSTLDDDKSIVKNRASGYRRTLTGFENTSFRDMSTAKATGGILSTVEDLYLWDQALYTDKLLSEKYRDLLFKPNLGNYGYGWNIRKVPAGENMETTLVSHSGGISGFNSLIYRFVEDNHMIVMFKNIRNTVGLGQIMQKIGLILYDQPYELPKESAARKVALTSIESGVDAAVREYHKLKNYHSDAYSFAEGDFNGIGYELLGMNKFDAAVAILKLNVEAFPASANTYDSLGEAYMLTGDTDSAIKNYKLALGKIPTDPNLSASFKEALKKGAEDKLSQLQAMAEKR